MYMQYFLEYFDKFDYSAFGDKKTAPRIPDASLDSNVGYFILEQSCCKKQQKNSKTTGLFL